MPEEVIRLRTTVVVDESLARIRQLEQTIVRMQREAGRGAGQANQQFQNLSKTFTGMHREVAALGRSLGSMLGGLTAGMVLRGVADMAKRVTELKFASRELGMSERDIRAWQNAAEGVGGSASSMLQGLTKFRDVTQGLRFNVGGVRDDIIRMGGGPVLKAIEAATTQAEKLRIAFKFGEQFEPGSIQWRTWFDQIGIGAENARIGYERFAKAREKLRDLTDAEKEAAEKLTQQVVDLGRAWDGVLVRAIPGLTTTLELTSSIVDKVSLWVKLYNSIPRLGGGATTPLQPGDLPQSQSGAPAETAPEGRAARNRRETWEWLKGVVPKFQHGGISAGGLAMLHSGEAVVPLAGGSIPVAVTGADGEDTVEEGTFRALVRFASYRNMAGGGGGGLGSGSLGGGGGPGPGGGGGGGGSSGLGGGGGGGRRRRG